MIQQATSQHVLPLLGSLEWYNLRIPIFLHICATFAATVGGVGLSLPFWTALALCATLFFFDRTVFFVYPALIIMTLGFLSPLILSGLPIALKVPPNRNEYDHDLLLSIYWFISAFSFYVTAANRLQHHDLSSVRIGKTDLVTWLAGATLLVFSALMLQHGTLASSGYRDITEERQGFIEFASVFTLVGFCAARSSLARRLLLVCALIYLASAFVTGLRLRFISVAIVTFCCFMGIRIQSKWKIGGLVIGFVLFVLGLVRVTGFSAASLKSSLAFENQFIQGALVSTAGGAFQTSKFHAYYVEHVAAQDGIPGITFLFSDLAAVFITRSALPDALEIKSQVTNSFNIPGGGLMPGYFFAYTGIFGVILLSIAVTWLFMRLLRLNGTEAFPYQVLLAAYAPRMLLYDWTAAFKMMFYFFILKSILLFLVQTSNRAKSSYVSPRKNRLE